MERSVGCLLAFLMSAVVDAHKTVLVIEDNADEVFFFQSAVHKKGCPFTFRFVSDGEEAIAYMKGEGPFSDRKANPFPTLVLLDLMLPKLNGFEVLDWMRQTPGCKEVRVIVWSGWNYPANIERAKKAGVDSFIVKGLEGNAANVISLIESELGQEKAASQAVF